MGAVLQYINQSGVNKERVWEVGKDRKFTALIKCFVQNSGEQNLHVIEKPSTRPATFQECCRFVQKLKNEYGDNVKQIIIWDMDAMKENYHWQ